MSAFTKAIASVISIPVTILKPVIKQIGQDMKELEQIQATRAAMSKMEIPELTEDELQEVLKKRARQAASR
jgi:hypothetical protein